eukprot:COSAG05_NODE_24007_length_254_cov_0.922581_1_plen_27_part_10
MAGELIADCNRRPTTVTLTVDSTRMLE